MKNSLDLKKDETSTEQPSKDQATKTKAPKSRREPAAKPLKEAKAAEVESGGRLPKNLEELKASKGGLVSFLFLSGKAKEDIATELKAAFKVTDAQAAKIVRRITGRARFFQRVAELMAAK